MKKDNFEHYFANPEVNSEKIALKFFFKSKFFDFQVRDAINWNYFAPPSKTTVHLVDYFIKLLSQIDFELPFFKIIESLSTNSVDISTEKYRVNESNSQNKIFAYIFHHSNSIDLKGNINLLEGEWIDCEKLEICVNRLNFRCRSYGRFAISLWTQPIEAVEQETAHTN